MPDVDSPDAVVVEDDDRVSGHAPDGTEQTPQERAVFDAADVEDGEPVVRGDIALPSIRILDTPNQSSRKGQRIRGIVIHETQGGYGGAVGWLQRPDVQASAHIVLKEDGSEATQLVPWGMKSWHAVGANSYTIGLELAGFVDKPNDPAQLARAARICGFWCERFGIPPVHQTKAWDGISTHKDLGAFGGGHNDPGGFDIEAFIAQIAAEVARGGFRAAWGRD